MSDNVYRNMLKFLGHVKPKGKERFAALKAEGVGLEAVSWLTGVRSPGNVSGQYSRLLPPGVDIDSSC